MYSQASVFVSALSFNPLSQDDCYEYMRLQECIFLP